MKTLLSHAAVFGRGDTGRQYQNWRDVFFGMPPNEMNTKDNDIKEQKKCYAEQKRQEKKFELKETDIDVSRNGNRVTVVPNGL